ncbi:MOSC domain-containing protein [Macrococcus carouselicus]|uniref:MOSC domain-containing protein n=1 Tax=Macrococcus carouselicus TaxID=69969 RepID=A0A9Q8FQ23_9STAP|nr:MOSC domain-containing protein [Macrococcus carouselicus]TDM03607.1 MOSC domain-containing protein [Macrococcus carouselicus]
MNYEIVKICTGKVEKVMLNGKPKKTGVNKYPITETNYLSKMGFEGDEHEYKGHGGINKAVCLYDKLDYTLWQDYIHDMPDYAMFGENITTIGLTKDRIAIGDIFKLGEAVIQVTEGRGPCNTIAKKYKVPSLVKMMSMSHATGCYFRVLQEGYVQPDSNLILLERDPANFTLEAFNTLLYTDKKNVDLLKHAVSVTALSEDQRQTFQQRLDRLQDNQ